MTKTNKMRKVSLPTDWADGLLQDDPMWAYFSPYSIKKVHFLNQPLAEDIPLSLKGVIHEDGDIVIAVSNNEEEIYFSLEDENCKLDVCPLCLSDFQNLQTVCGLDVLYDKQQLADLPDYIY